MEEESNAAMSETEDALGAGDHSAVGSRTERSAPEFSSRRTLLDENSAIPSSPVELSGFIAAEEDDDLNDERTTLRRRLLENGRSFPERLCNQTNLMARLHDMLKDSQQKISGMQAAERGATFGGVGLSTLSVTSPARLGDCDTSTPQMLDDATAEDSSFSRLLQEQERSRGLNELNSSLRRELDGAKMATVSLTSDLLRVTQEFDRMRRERQTVEEDRKKKEKVYLERLSMEHRQMLQLWRSFQQLRREFLDCRSSTKRGLNTIESEFQRVSKGAATACQKMNMWLTYTESVRAVNSSVGVQDASSPSMVWESGAEELILENIKRLTESQTEREELVRQLQQRVDELSEQKQLLEAQLLERDNQLEVIKDEGAKSKEKEDTCTVYLHNALRDLAHQALSQDSPDESNATPMVSPRRRARSHSPGGIRGRAAAAAEATVRLVKDALDRRQKEAEEATIRLRTLQQRISETEQVSSNSAAIVRRLEKDLGEANSRLITLQRELDDALKQKESKIHLIGAKDEAVSLERKKYEAAETRIENLRRELEGRIIQLESRLQNALDERDRGEDEIARYKIEIANSRRSFDTNQAMLADAREEGANLRLVNVRLERQIHDLVVENEASKENAKELEAKRDELSDNLERLTSSEREAGERYSALQQEHQTLVHERDAIVRERSTLESRLEQMEVEFFQLRRKKEAADIEARTTSDELDAFKQSEAVWNQERTLLLNQLEKRDADLHELEGRFDVLKNERVHAGSQLKMALEKQLELESQLEACRRDLSSEHEKSFHVHEESQRLASERHELEQRVLTLTEQIHRHESRERQIEEKFQARLLELERKLEQTDQDAKANEALIFDLNRRIEDVFEEKTNAESRANSLQTVVLSQEELIRMKETEKRNVQARLSQVEVQLRGRESQLKQQGEKLEKSNADVEKINAEKRIFKAEFDRLCDDRQRFSAEVSKLTVDVQRLRSQVQESTAAAEVAEHKSRSLANQIKIEEEEKNRLEREMAAIRLSLARSQENESALQTRLDDAENLLSETNSSTQNLRDQLLNAQQLLRTTEQEKRTMEERFRDAKEQFSRIKAQLKTSLDEHGLLESKLLDVERHSADKDSQLKALQTMLSISQETEVELKRQLENAVAQKRDLHSRLGDLQEKLGKLEASRKDGSASNLHLEREAADLRQKLMMYEDEIHKNEVALRSAVKERMADERAMRAMEEKSVQLESTVTQLQTKVANMEQTHANKLQGEQRRRAEKDSDIIKLQDELRQFVAVDREKDRKIKSLQDQIQRLKEQLDRQDRQRQELICKMANYSQDTAQLLAGLDSSVAPLLPLVSPVGSPKQSSTPIKRRNLNSTAKSSFNNSAADPKHE